MTNNPEETDNLDKHHDEFYQALMAAHEGLGIDESHRLNARLVLLMASRIGDIEMLKSILKLSQRDIR